MDTQAAPDTGARLGPQAIEALILRRLDALGHRPDLLDRQAIAALVADAGGSGRRLRSSLAATLFLASTENASQIDAALVRRALAPARPAIIQPGPTSQAAATRPKWFTASRFYLVAGLAALAVSLTNLVLRPPPNEPAAVPAKATRAGPEAGPPPAPAATPTPMVAQTSPTPPQLSPQTSPQASSQSSSQATPQSPTRQEAAPPAAPVLAPLPPAVAVRSPPVPQSSLPAAVVTLPPLPAGAPAAIVLLYPARDPGALDRLRPLALKLQNAGITDIRAKPVHAPPPRRVISYFYSDDRPLADTIARTLSGSAWPRLGSNALQPSLVLPPPGLPGHNPGTIEVQLP